MHDAEGRIPQDVLDIMAVSIGPISDEERRLRRVLEAYERRVGNLEEPTYRKQLARLYCEWVPGDDDRLMTPQQRQALERCAEGEPYTLPEE